MDGSLLRGVPIKGERAGEIDHNANTRIMTNDGYSFRSWTFSKLILSFLWWLWFDERGMSDSAIDVPIIYVAGNINFELSHFSAYQYDR